MKLTPMTKNLLKPILIVMAVGYLPCVIMADFAKSMLGLNKRVTLNDSNWFDKLGNKVFE